MKDNKSILKMIWIFVLIISVLIIGTVLYMYNYLTSPEQIYKKMVSKITETILSPNVQHTEKIIMTNTQIDINFEGNNENANVSDVINDIDFSLNTQLNLKEKKLVVGLETKYKDEEMIQVKSFLDSDKKTAHIYLQNLLDKYLKLNLEDNVYETIDFAINNMLQSENKSIQYFVNIIGNEARGIIKPGYCSKNKATIQINGSEQKVTNNILTMTLHELVEGIVGALNNLKNNNQFLAYLGTSKNDIVANIESIIKKLNSSLADTELNNVIIKINTYTSGLIPKVEKIKLDIINDDSTTEVVIDNISENSCNVGVKLNSNNQGTITIQTKNKKEYIDTIDSIDKNKEQSIDYFTEEDAKELARGLKKSNLYKYIEKYINTAKQKETVN